MTARFRLTGRCLRPDAPGMRVLAQALAEGAGLHAAGTDVTARPGAPWVTCQSSGSSGTPRTIRRSPESWIASFEVNAGLFGLGARDTVATLGAVGHSLTLYAAVEALHLGAAFLPLAGLGARAQAQGLAQASVLYATPTQLRMMLAGPGAGWPGLRLVLVGGGMLDAGLRADLAAHAPNARIHAFFGASETSFITLTDADTPPGSVGRAYPGVSLRVDATGEIAVASPYLFDGYDGPPSPDTRREGAWLRFGELGHLDDSGALTLTGRTSRRVRIAETWVSPELAEAALAPLAPCAVIAAPDARRGAHLVAVVQGEPALEPRLRALCAALPVPARPRRYVFVPALPLLPAGKPDLAALTRRWA